MPRASFDECWQHPLRRHLGPNWGTTFGRGERIRTSGLYVPNVALYQAKLHPDGTE